MACGWRYGERVMGILCRTLVLRRRLLLFDALCSRSVRYLCLYLYLYLLVAFVADITRLANE